MPLPGTHVVSSSLDLSQLFSFELDPFQQDAIAALDSGQSVIVSAPTGSGKTVIGEYAIHRALHHQQRVFYTTPLKALSNQKLQEFCDRFGTATVGLLTGDRSVNREAPILVMTTEIFRNILYGTLMGDLGTSLAGVAAVVLDECHYMNDQQRGTVWEESIIYCPPEIQIIGLSATVANADQLTEWISWVHGPTALIASDYRPVPLNFHFCTTKGLLRLLNEQQTKMHPQLKTHLNKAKGSKHGGRHRGGNRRAPNPGLPTMPYLLSQLQERDMLPAIYFIFSRRGCDKAVQEAQSLSLVNPQEAAELARQIERFQRQDSTNIIPEEHIQALHRGIAAHHAGLLPVWKGLVEDLFQQGLIKVVFATETLAAGINMPARTTVISSLSKRTDVGHRLLTASEFLQISGRAGRRGLDDRGHVVTLQTRFEGAKEAAYLATVGPDPLVSQFTPSYGMVLNLLQTHSLDEAKALIEKSFGQYLANLQLTPQKDAIADVERELNQLQAKLAEVDVDAINSYQKLQQRIKEEKRLVKILQQQAQESQAKDMALILAYAPEGTLLGLHLDTTAPTTPTTAVLVRHLPSSGQLPYLVCLTSDNVWQIVSHQQVACVTGHFEPVSSLAALTLPPALVPKPGRHHQGDEMSSAIATQLPPIDWEPAPEVVEQQQRLADIAAKLEHHPAHTYRQSHSAVLRWQRRIRTLEEQLQDRKNKLQQQTNRHWDEFMGLVTVLEQFAGLHNNQPTLLGQQASALRGENELWLGLVFHSGHFETLAPQQLAAACAALVWENNRTDSWTHYRPSPEVLDALRELRSTRSRLLRRQLRQQIQLPVLLETEFIGIVEHWALATDWTELCSHTSLDAGDLVRMLRRTLDILSQIPHMPKASEALCQNARRAQQLMDRFPISEVNEILLETDAEDILSTLEQTKSQEQDMD